MPGGGYLAEAVQAAMTRAPPLSRSRRREPRPPERRRVSSLTPPSWRTSGNGGVSRVKRRHDSAARTGCAAGNTYPPSFGYIRRAMLPHPGTRYAYFLPTTTIIGSRWPTHPSGETSATPTSAHSAEYLKYAPTI